MKKDRGKNTGEVEKRVFSDPSLPAGLEARNKFEARNKSFKIIPQRNPTNGQVEFLVEGENIDEALQEIYSNAPVGVLDFIKSLKSFRSSIFALKGGRK